MKELQRSDLSFAKFSGRRTKFESEESRYYKQRMKLDKQFAKGQGGFDVSQCYEDLKQWNSKTMKTNEYSAFIHNQAVRKFPLLKFHNNKPQYRKMRFNRKTKRVNSIRKQMAELKGKIGDPSKVIIGFGDYSQNRAYRGQVPVMRGKALRTVLRKEGYEVYLVHEFRTTHRCYHCGSRGTDSITEEFLMVPNPNKKPRNLKNPNRPKHVKCNGLLRCTNISCARLINREVNGAANILLAFHNALEGIPRPQHLSL
jgi:hypothetical protein